MISAILLAGGSGKRMGAGMDKLMLMAANVPLLAHALTAFQKCPDVDEIILVAREDRKDSYRQLASTHQIDKLVSVVPGGVERQDSVWCGLQVVSSKSEIVLIHDAARALVTPQIISNCVASARKMGAAIPASRVKDTIKRAQDATSPSQIEMTVDRSQLWAAQTPQTFRTELIRRAYEPLIRENVIVTDDAAAVEKMGHPVFLVDSDPLNLKITTPEDLLLAEIILSKRIENA
jgi:2-C-methyl-D-erythritol 4-phosphate cytidylyltransferase